MCVLIYIYKIVEKNLKHDYFDNLFIKFINNLIFHVD